MNKAFMSGLAGLAISLALLQSAASQDDPPRTLITNVHVFDGVSEQRIENAHVLVEGNLIEAVSTDSIEAEGAKVIDGGGRTIMPGLIENHAHLMLPGPTLPAMEANSTWEDLAIHGALMAEMYLMQGFTTVRDAGGANGGLRRAIDSGKISTGIAAGKLTKEAGIQSVLENAPGAEEEMVRALIGRCLPFVEGFGDPDALLTRVEIFEAGW